MPDHIPLSPPVPTDSRRRPPGGGGDEIPVDRARKATTIAGILSGLETSGIPLFGGQANSAPAEDEVDDLGRIVLKFTTKGQPKKGPLGAMKMIPLGENDDNEFFTLSSAESRELFASLVQRYGSVDVRDSDDPRSWYELLDQVENIAVYDRQDRADLTLAELDFAAPSPVDVVLWPTSILADARAKRLAVERVAEIEALVDAVRERGGYAEITATDTRPETPLVRAVVDDETLQLLLGHPVVERVRGPLIATIGPSQLVQAGERPEVPSADGVAIGVIDDLVSIANPWMADVVKGSKHFPEGRVYHGATAHGTNVASIAAFGSFDGVLAGATVPAPFPIFAARVAEANAHGNPTVVENPVSQFEQAITWLHTEGARIVVIAFGYDYPDTDPFPTELTATIDRLARDLRLVIVVSAGNLRKIRDGLHWRDDYPTYLSDVDARIAAPGTAALAVTVGSSATRTVPHDTTLTAVVGQEHEVSPFSRTGPTRGNRFGKTRKPELTGPGGNWGWNEATKSLAMSDPNLGVVTLSTRATPLFTVSSGTSLAAPFVAHEIARIATRYPTAGPNLLRALVALAGQPPASRPGLNLGDGAVASAYGLPDASRVLESGANHAILVHEGQIQSGGRLIFRLPIPPEFAAPAPQAVRRLRIALAFDPPVRRSRRDYIAGRMQFDFVQNMPFDDVKRTWEVQPSVAEAEAHGLSRDSLPNGHQRPRTIPGVDLVRSNTLIRRDVETAGWDPDDEDYFLVVSHDTSPWTDSQLNQYPTQEFALAIELIDEGRPELDLHALTTSRLDFYVRQTGRARGIR